MVKQVENIYPKSTSVELNNGKEFISLFIRSSWILLTLGALYQCLFYPDFINLMMLASVFPAWFITVKVFLRPIILMNFPLSTFLIFGFTLTQLYLPVIFTSLEGKPLIYNLELPEQVFFHSLATLLVLTLAHAFYRLLSNLSNKSFSPLDKIGFFTPPSNAQMWLMGLIGLAATYYVFFAAPDIGGEVTGEASDKFVQGLIPFSYAPFFIPFSRLYGKDQVHGKSLIPMLLAFTAILFAISIGRNSTGAFMIGFITVAFTYFLGLLLGVFRTEVLTFRNVFIAAIGLWLLVGPLADLRTAMVIVRGDREEIPAAELIAPTIDAFFDEEAIEQRRLDDASKGFETDWDERYLDNSLTARFANIKFNDASLLRAEIVGEYDPDMQEYSLDHFLGALPDPFLKALGIDVDKELVYSLSFGDFLYLTAGGRGVREGFRTGAIAGTGMATFGWWYLLVLGIGMIPIFFLFDIFLKKKRTSDLVNRPWSQQFQFSLCGLLALTSIFQFMTNESVVKIGTFLLRGWIQMALLYFLLFQVTLVLTGGFMKRLKFSSDN